MTAPTPAPKPEPLAPVEQVVADGANISVRILRWQDVTIKVPKAGEVHLVDAPILRLYVDPRDLPADRQYIDIVSRKLVTALRPLLDQLVARRAVLTLRRTRQYFSNSFDVQYPTD